MSTTILDKIKAYKLEEVAARKAKTTLGAVTALAKDAPAPRDFARDVIDATKTGYGLIAEIKKPPPQRD